MSATIELLRPAQEHAAPPRVIRLALAGCGVVGSELLRLLMQQGAAIQQQHGVRFELTRVLVRDTAQDRSVETPSQLFTNDLASFLAAPADVVIEAIGGMQPAFSIAQAAVTRGARFITANKALIAAHGVELHGAATTARSEIQFEAAVGASVPVIRVLREALGTARPTAIRGILNGTSNFVLTRLEEGVPFVQAVKEAQQRGLAEADPSRDLDGRDAEDKISILAWLAHGMQRQQLRPTRIGLLPDIERITRDAQAISARLRVVAECISEAAGVYINVEPVIVAADSGFGRTTHENNLISLDFGWKAPIQLSGPGAGGLPTASALLGDLLDVGPQLTIPRQPPRCITDPRPHRWSVSVKSNERAALERVHALNITSTIVQLRQGALCFHTAPITRSRLADLVAELNILGAHPAAVRLDLGRAAS